MRDSKLLLKDILEAISAIERFVEGIDFEGFRYNDEKSSAAIKNRLPQLKSSIQNILLKMGDR